ncbi:MAG: enoyl-CoA hydratase/isomerase family protein [Candidatus Accumulibacter sp.]|jgi:3-hydroxypropionyl-coenzyme A dehydratase|nr:enoyl-CoA hydratase/isomerase family protein [Accumulibacter sp.]
MNENLKVWRQDNIMVIQLRAERTLNALDMGMMDEIVERLREAERDSGTAAVVVAGSGRSFCTGADLKAFTGLTPEEVVHWCADIGNELFNRLATLSKPTLAAVNGYALGGGMELALACDFRFGHEKTQFGAPEYGFGWIPGWGGVHRLAKIVGPARAKQFLLFKERVRGADALALGLLNGLAPEPTEEALLDFTLAKARELAALNPLTVSYTKAILNDFEVPRHDSFLQGFTNGVVSKSEYARRAVEAFFEKGAEKKGESNAKSER